MNNKRESENVQIPRSIFMDLCKWHLANIRDPEREQRIKQALESKMKKELARKQFAEDHPKR